MSRLWTKAFWPAVFAAVLLVPPLFAGGAKEPAPRMTPFGTPRAETVIVQTFDARSPAPGVFNRYIAGIDNWHGARMLGHAYLWETDTGTGETVGELAAGPVEVLDDTFTRFRVRLRQGIYWSDGVEFSVDDVLYTLNMARENLSRLPGARGIDRRWKTATRIDRYTFEVETAFPDFYFMQNWGVWTWGAAALWIVPKHVYEKQEDISRFSDSDPVTLGAYVVDRFDPNGYWTIWRLRDDWQRSAWQVYTDRAPAPKYVVYQSVGPEDMQVLAFIQNDLDAATFMSWESIQAVQRRNAEVRTFSTDFPHFWMDDACAFGIQLNAQKEPFNNKDVRWALALATDLQHVTMSALDGAFRVSAIPMVDQPWMKETFFDPLIPWLEAFQLDDGYRPFNRNHANEVRDVLRQQGVANLPAAGDDTYTMLGAGWWRYDPEQAEKLMLNAGMRRGADGMWRLPDGSRWRPTLHFPGDWHTILQRMGFAIADRWNEFGIEVIASQVDSAEYGRSNDYNNILEARVGWPMCSFVTPVQFMQNLRQEFLMPGDAAEPILANNIRWDNVEADRLIARMLQTPPDDPRIVEMQRQVLKKLIEDMAVINLASIPTTIPQNWTYWSGWPTADNYYATPLTWWSSFKHVVMNLQPTGVR